MPSLTKHQIHARKIFIVHAQTIPPQSDIRLPETKLRHAAQGVRLTGFHRQRRIEVCLYLTAYLHAAPFVIHDINAHTGSYTQKTESSDGIQVLARNTGGLCLQLGLVPTLIEWLVVIQVTLPRDRLAAIVGEVVADKAV